MKVHNCFKCEISNTRKHIVNSFGNNKAPVLFIGNSPSYQDNKTGAMYSNNIGVHFIRLLKELELYKYSYFTYITRCYSGIRNSNQTEIKNCTPYLIKELQQHNFKVIVLLGSVALQTYWGNPTLKVSDNLGKISVSNNKIILSTYSPNYAIDPITPTKFNTFVSHLQIVNKILKQWNIKH